MLFAAQRAELEQAQKAARGIFDETGTKPKLLSVENVSTFWKELRCAVRLVFEEKEIVFFAALQWLVIGIAYTIWTQILDWIPDSLWAEVRKSDGEGSYTLINLVLLGWSFFVVLVASYPIAILNAAMTAAYYLRHAGQTSTVAKCFNLAFRNLGRLWVFTTIDAWITVNAIVDRLPRKRNNRTALDELLYYAWKIGTIGVVPALVAGKGYIDAAKDSVALLTHSPLRAIGIRMGYSLICWIIGIAAYAGAIGYLIAFGGHRGARVNDIYNFYLFMALPIFIAAGITAVLVRPFYLLMVSKLYTDVVPVDKDVTALTTDRMLNALTLCFAVLLCILLALYFFGDQLGFRDWIESLARMDIRTNRQLTPRS